MIINAKMSFHIRVSHPLIERGTWRRLVSRGGRQSAFRRLVHGIFFVLSVCSAVAFSECKASEGQSKPGADPIEVLQNAADGFERARNEDIALRDAYWIVKTGVEGRDFDKLVEELKGAKLVEVERFNGSFEVALKRRIKIHGVGERAIFRCFFTRADSGKCVFMDAALHYDIARMSLERVTALFDDGGVISKISRLEHLQKAMQSAPEIEGMEIAYRSMESRVDELEYFGFTVKITGRRRDATHKYVSYGAASGLDEQKVTGSGEKIPAVREVLVRPPTSTPNVIFKRGENTGFWFIDEGSFGS